MIKKINSKSTKAEILEAIDELQKENTELESKLKTASKIKQPESPKNMPEITNNNTSIKSTQTLQSNISQTLQNLEKLQVGFGSAVSDLSEQLIKEASALEDLREEVAKELEQLQELHELEIIEENTLDTLIQSYDENSKTFEEEISQQREILVQEIQDLRTAWKKEQESHGRDIEIRNDDYQKNRERDEEQYWYNLNLERSLDLEQYELQKKDLYQELSETLQIQEKEWKEREETIAKREKEQAEAKAKVEDFEKELEAKIKQGKEEGKGIGNYQAKIKTDLRNKEVEGEKEKL